MQPEHLALYGLKFDPFVPDVPVEAMRTDPALELFCWRIEQMVRHGGFGAIDGEPGTGKSVALRVIEARLGARSDLTVGVLTRPQSTVGDFYRELGHIFGVGLTPHNRWAGAKALREMWLAHIDASRYRPVLLVDEAQEMQPAVLSELRLLASPPACAGPSCCPSPAASAPGSRSRRPSPSRCSPISRTCSATPAAPR